MALHDIHAHLTDPRLAAIENSVIDRARQAGVTTIVSNGLNPADNEAVLALSKRHDIVRPAFGFYPVHVVLPEMREMGVEYADDSAGVSFEEGFDWLAANLREAVALGEVGLDHYWVPEALWQLQEDRFRRLIELALAFDKPMIIHTRKAERRALDVLLEMGVTRVDWHCFSSKVKLGRTIAEAGHYLSIPANARRAENFRRLLETLPRDKVLLETDCPYLGPEREMLNEPSNVRGTAELASELWACSIERVHDQLEENLAAFLG